MSERRFADGERFAIPEAGSIAFHKPGRLVAPLPERRWLYAIEQVVHVIDGDTLLLRVRAPIDFGFRRKMELSSVEEFRLVGIDTPERKGATRKMGDAAAEALAGWFTRPGGEPAGLDPFTLESVGEEDDKYGRWLARITHEGDTDLGEWLVLQGFAQPYDGKGPRPLWDPAAPFPLVARPS